MNDRFDSEFEQLVEGSLDSRAAQLGPPAGQIGDVYNRLEQRRDRRRRVAVVGSLASVGICIGGFMALSNAPDPAEQLIGAAAVGEQAAASPTTVDVGPIPTTTMVMPLSDVVWACNDPIPDELAPTHGGPIEYFSYCEQVLVDPDVPITVVPMTTIGPLGSSPVLDSDVDCTAGSTPDPILLVEDSRNSEQRYIVVPGDSIMSIGERYGVDPAVLTNYNNWSDCLDHLIVPGDVVLIPPNAGTVVIEVDCYGGTTTSAPAGYRCRTPADEVLPWMPTTSTSTAP